MDCQPVIQQWPIQYSYQFSFFAIDNLKFIYLEISGKSCTDHLGNTCEGFLAFRKGALTKHPIPCNQLIDHFYTGKFFSYNGTQLYLTPPTGKLQYNSLHPRDLFLDHTHHYRAPSQDFLCPKKFFWELDIALAFCHLCRLGLFGFFALPPPQQHKPPKYCQFTITHLTTSVKCLILSFTHIHSLSYTEFSTSLLYFFHKFSTDF